MRYSLGESLDDFAFVFYEKIHEPIFLLHRSGRICKTNEAARKLMNVANLKFDELSKLGEGLSEHFRQGDDRFKRFHFDKLKVIAHNLRDSEFILVEVTH